MKIYEIFYHIRGNFFQKCENIAVFQTLRNPLNILLLVFSFACHLAIQVLDLSHFQTVNISFMTIKRRFHFDVKYTFYNFHKDCLFCFIWTSMISKEKKNSTKNLQQNFSLNSKNRIQMWIHIFFFFQIR